MSFYAITITTPAVLSVISVDVTNTNFGIVIAEQLPTTIGFINTTIGSDGKSAYQVAVDNGFVGSEAQWLASLQGGGTWKTIIQTASSSGAMTIALNNALSKVDVFINGLAQTDYTFTSTLLTLPASLNIISGDVLTIKYL